MATKRREVKLDLKPELSQVVARDFNLFYQPEQKPTDPSVDIFVKSLDNFVNQAGTKMVIVGEKKEKEVNEAEAKKMWETGKQDFKKLVEDGSIDKNANPYLIDKYKELDLNSKAREFKNKLYKEYERLKVSENAEEGAFDKFYKKELEKFVKDNELLNFDAVDLNKGFFSLTDKTYNGLSNTHSQTQLSKIGERYKKTLKENIIGAIEEGNDGDPDTMPNVGDAINKLIQDNIHLRTGTELRDFVLAAVEEWITNTDDFDYAEEVLESLMDYVDGGTNKFKNIGVVKNKIDALQQHLTKEKNEFDDEEVKIYNNKVKVGKIEVRKNLAEKMKQEDFNFYEWRKSDEYLNLMPEVQEEAKKYYSSMGGSFAGTTDAGVLTKLYKLITKGDVYEDGGADAFLEQNKDLFSKADYVKFKTKTIPNAFYTTGDELKNHPIFSDFDDMATVWLRSPTTAFNPVASFLKYSRWKEDIYDWMSNNSLEKFGGDKQKRADAFKAYVQDQMKNFTLSGLEEIYVPPEGEGS